jgi:hypothetical protein
MNLSIIITIAEKYYLRGKMKCKNKIQNLCNKTKPKTVKKIKI